MVACRFFTPDEYQVREAERRAAVDKWRAEHPEVDLGKGWPPELVELNGLFFPPGSMWFCPWYHDPSKPEDLAKVDEMIAKMAGHEAQHPRHAEGYRWHLSIHYWRDWARIRPPIEVVCPGGGGWCPDQISSSGTGWTVTGEPPLITCTPSIWVAQGQGQPREYHGWLNAGVFSAPV
jgi:hypothetical protein